MTAQAGVTKQRPKISDEALEERIAKLREGTEATVDEMVGRSRSILENAANRMNTAPQKLEQRRQAGLDRIRELDLASAKAEIEKDRQDIVRAIAGLAEVNGQIDESFRALTAPNAEDNAIRARADAAVT